MCIRDSGRAKVVFTKLLVDSLGIKVSLMFPDNSFSTVSEDLRLKYSIEELLLLQEEILVFSSSWLVVGVKDMREILSPCLVTEELVPSIIDFFILKCREQTGVSFDPTTEKFSWCVLGSSGGMTGGLGEASEPCSVPMLVGSMQNSSKASWVT